MLPALMTTARAALLVLVACTALPLPGCGSSSALRVQSAVQGTYLEPEWLTNVFTNPDRETTQIILSDLSPDDLRAALSGNAGGAAGNVVTINMFVRPKAGKTPIDDTACNATITHVVLAGSGYGVYGGGGFVLPSSSFEDASFNARMSRATLKFLASRGGFTDQLESSEIGGRIGATREDALTKELSSRLTVMLGR